jgi:hypothetical protein
MLLTANHSCTYRYTTIDMASMKMQVDDVKLLQSDLRLLDFDIRDHKL